MNIQTFTEQNWPDQQIKHTNEEQPVVTKNTAELEPNTLKGVYKSEGGLYRAAIRPKGSSQWYTLGFFVCPHVAAKVFNIYALTMDLFHLVNHDIQPNEAELEKWRTRKAANAKRENLAEIEYHKQWGSKQ